MSSSPPAIRIAGLREDGAGCLHCDDDIRSRDETVTCPECGTIHHWGCWKSQGGCGSYDCRPENSGVADAVEDAIRITVDELDRAVPLPTGRPITAGVGPAVSIPVGPHPEELRWNRLAIAAFVVALAGIPLFGIVTGLIALLLGCLALTGRYSFKRRGFPLAVMAICLGIADFIGWTVFLYSNVDPAKLAFVIQAEEPDLDALQELPAPINRAMKANVLIQSGGLFQQGIGSGVVLQVSDGRALIVTNRHVVDPSFDGSGDGVLDELAELTVKLIGQPAASGRAVWLAPDDIDLALVSVPVVSDQVMAAIWHATSPVKIGDTVFAVGNPHGLGWTHTGGDVSQIRRRASGDTEYRVIQTSAAINPGNSGGGLYDKEGRLIGINTWTQDKRFAEGLGFAIAFETLLNMVPNRFRLSAQQDPKAPSE